MIRALPFFAIILILLYETQPCVRTVLFRNRPHWCTESYNVHTWEPPISLPPWWAWSFHVARKMLRELMSLLLPHHWHYHPVTTGRHTKSIPDQCRQSFSLGANLPSWPTTTSFPISCIMKWTNTTTCTLRFCLRVRSFHLDSTRFFWRLFVCYCFVSVRAQEKNTTSLVLWPRRVPTCVVLWNLLIKPTVPA